jgi:hypothetical protein
MVTGRISLAKEPFRVVRGGARCGILPARFNNDNHSFVHSCGNPPIIAQRFGDLDATTFAAILLLVRHHNTMISCHKT